MAVVWRFRPTCASRATRRRAKRWRLRHGQPGGGKKKCHEILQLKELKECQTCQAIRISGDDGVSKAGDKAIDRRNKSVARFWVGVVVRVRAGSQRPSTVSFPEVCSLLSPSHEKASSPVLTHHYAKLRSGPVRSHLHA